MKLKFFSAVLAFGILCPPVVSAKDRITHDSKVSNTDVILHAWCWNFPTIADNMASIAKAGYSIVQTSPVEGCFNPEGGSKKLFDETGGEGNWYNYYQPVNWKIGNQIVGSKDQMKAMLDSAAKYNIKVIVDVVPNHTAFDIDCVEDEMAVVAGGRDKLYHSEGFKPVSNYDDRLQCTLWGSGGLPDVNTENPGFQKYFLQFLNELLQMGVSGFRYDTAKHIGLPSDPVDKASGCKANDFWDIVSGRKAVKGVKLCKPYDDLFVYGEILQGENVPEREYAEYMNQTASNYGHIIREILEKGSAKGVDLLNWRHTSAPEYLTSWVETHDTYCNAHESAGLSDEQIRTGWVFITARQNGTPLFYSRPMGSTRQNYWGDNRIGIRGNDEFLHPEVAAVNHFRKKMDGQKEDIRISDNGEVLLVNRGSKGAALVNISNLSNTFLLPTGLPDGKYRDMVYDKEFVVKNGKLSGLVAPHRSYILVN